MAKSPPTPEHIDFEQYSDSPAEDNSGAGAFTDVIVNVPQNITIRMVNASALSDYEIWVFIASLLSNAVVGFGVAYFQAVDAKSATITYIGWTWIVFAALWVLAIIFAFMKRTVMTTKGKDIKLRTTSASRASD
jgi:Na+/proline symporter